MLPGGAIKGRLVKPFEDVAFSIKPNVISKPVHTQYGWHIIEALGPVKAATPAKPTPLSQVKEAIRQTLLQTKRNTASQDWQKKTTKDYCKKIAYQTGYAPPPGQDPCKPQSTCDGDRLSIDSLALGETLLELQQLTERLRRDCPWDREQTARTIVPHTVEEAYEVADAALADDQAKLLDELGDLLFQVYFLALLLSEEGAGDLEQVARNVHEKLVRRHPHVFGDIEARTAGRVRANWERIKSEEEGREGIFHDVPEALPALLYARKVQRRAASINFEYPDTAGALADLDDELRELKAALAEAGETAAETEPDPHVVEEVGDVLFAAVNVARRLNVDPELACGRTSDRFVARVERAEALAGDEGKEFTSLGLEEQDRVLRPRQGGAALSAVKRRPRSLGSRLARQPDGRGRRAAGVGRVRAGGRSLRRVDRRARGARASRRRRRVGRQGRLARGRERQRRDRVGRPGAGRG